MTIEQIQTAIDEKLDARQIINMIADYIQANPGGGGSNTSSLPDYSAPLTGDELIALSQSAINKKISLDALFSAPLWGDRTIDLNGHALEIGDASDYKLRIVAGDTIEIYAGNKQISLPGLDMDFGDLENVTNGAHFRISNTGSGFIQFSNNLTNKYFEANYTDAFYVLGDNDGTNNGSKIHIDDTAETILLKADNGTIITFPSSDPHVAGAWWDNSGTLTRSSG